MLVKRSAIVAACVGGITATAYAAVITTQDVMAIPQNVVGSGNGTLDLRLMTYSGSEITNSSGSFNGDNGNNTLPQGGGTDTFDFAESYVTTAGDLKAFYNLNFAPGTINEIMLFLDLIETGGGAAVNQLVKLDIILNPTATSSLPNPAGDVSSAAQAAINQIYSGGTVTAWLNPEPADNIPLNNQGAGWADYAISTGINPFALNDSDVLLFNVSMESLNDGAEELFISGEYSQHDVPEPTALFTLAIAGLLLIRTRPSAR